MLGVSAMPTSPGLGGFGSPQTPMSTNGVGKHFDSMSTSQIKAQMIEAVRRESKGAGAKALIKAARSQIVAAHEYESKGDLKNALASYTKGGSLVRAALDSTEYKRESGSGDVHKDCFEFQKTYSLDMATRMTAIEEKLKALEKLEDGPNTTSMGGIQERIQALKNNGLPLGDAPKRFSQQGAKYPTPPTSPRVFTTPNTTSSTTLMSPLQPSTPVSTSSSPHALVSPSSFGPPSPTSTPSSSPVLMFSTGLPSAPPIPSPSRNLSISSTEAKFPSISELDETFVLPSVPTGLSTGSGSGKSIPTTGSSTASSPSYRNFLPLERPSSTPLTPTLNSFISRPGSPSKPPVPLKPSALSTHAATTAKAPLPNSGTAFPKELETYLHNYNVLVLDVRNRADFDKAHIKVEAIVCVEPVVLARSGLTAERLEDSMVNAPTNETTMFKNRDKFDLIVVYDQSSQTLEPTTSPMSILVCLISEQAFTKLLKRMPMMLVGGFDAWRQDMGEARIVSSPALPLPRTTPPNGTAVLPGPGSYGSSSTSASMSNGVNSSNGVSTPSTFASSNGPGNTNGLGRSVNGFSNSTGYGSSNGFSKSTSMANSSGSSSSTTSTSETHQVWTPRSRADTDSNPPGQLFQHRHNYSLDQTFGHSRSPAEITYPSNYQSPDYNRPSNRRPAVSRGPASAGPSSFPSISENVQKSYFSTSPSLNAFLKFSSPALGSPPMVNGTSSISYPSFPPRMSPSISAPSIHLASIASPPQASINPSLSRRRSDYVDQSQEAVSGLHQRPPIDYPSQHILRPPPLSPSPVPPVNSSDAPRIPSDYPPTYWPDASVGTSGLKNMGNTCYMNAPVQCLSATFPFAQFFASGRWKHAVNTLNPLGSKGILSGSFARLVNSMWLGDMPYITPLEFRKAVCHLNSQYNGSNQHDSQEFLSFLLDGIHEDLNRLLEEAELEQLGPQIASEREWRQWKRRNDSIIVDFFQGQFRNRLQCLTCHTTSTTYNVFSILQSSKVPLQSCLDAFFNTEILDKDDAWYLRPVFVCRDFY
ncbi:hypothetical protein B0H10DRAFT_2024179 [Mycena sp. CBHHK59/15]|nr:hypothetical protein B0H10DRAFT_2024179 [Mycena sp. CBHHK59/15]